MNEIKQINAGEGYAHASVGTPSNFTGKAFLKDAVGTTSCEISFGSLASGEAVPFFHDHKENEEIYIILSGSGRFQVDAAAFDIAAGSVVRVSTGHSRCLKNSSGGTMVYLCVQAKEQSLSQWVMEDAVVTEVTPAL